MPDTATQKKPNEHRPLSQIAREISADWSKQFKSTATADKFYAARPYLRAMQQMDQINEKFYADDGVAVVLYFLNNVKSWTGDEARRIKAELKEIVRSTGYPLK